MNDIVDLMTAIRKAVEVRQQKASRIRETLSPTLTDEQLIRSVDELNKIKLEAEQKVMSALHDYLQPRNYSIISTPQKRTA